MTVLRIDQGTSEIIKPMKLANGFLRVDATTTRAGVFAYTNPDGTVRRELRLPEEVFAREAMDSFALMPVTDTHPPQMLNAANAAQYQRGSAGDPRRDGDHMAQQLMITDKELVRKIESGEAQELSNGYNCDLEEKAGVHPTYGPYDAIQRNIRGNHIAVVKRGRAGPSARVRMDEASVAVLSIRSDGEERPVVTPPQPPQQPNGETPVKLIRIDGLELDPTTDAFAQALAKQQQKHADELKAKTDALAAMTAATDKLQAKFDAQAEELAKAKEEIKALPAKLQASAKARVDLETKARKVLGQKFKLDSLDDKTVKVTVLERLDKKFKAEGKTDAYLDARFDLAIESFDADAAATVRTAVDPVVKTDDAEETEEVEHTDSVAAFERMQKNNDEAWKNTLKRATES